MHIYITKKTKNLFSTLILTTYLLTSFTACSTNQAGQINKTDIGTVGGAVAGGLLGSTIGRGNGQVAAIAVGAVLGGLAGNAVGASLDKTDLEYMRRTQQRSLEYNTSGSASEWRNPDSGVRGSITPTKTYHHGNSYCREFVQTVQIGGRNEEAYGKACRQPDGAWQIVQ